MKYDFSAQFMRVLPPDTSFADAWESLCYVLLDAEYGDSSLIRLRPPDKGVDILHRKSRSAYQCKSDERGAFGSIGAAESIGSLKTAVAARKALGWDSYSFASNANFTGTAFAAITQESERLGFQEQQLEFLGPEHWDKLCCKHPHVVEGRFDYRVSVTKECVSKAFENQRYYPQSCRQYAAQLQDSDLVLRISNNRTPVILEVPFSPELTVEHLVDVIKDLLGVSLDWANFTDLGTSAGPSISLTIDRIAQSFPKKIGELTIDRDHGLQFWITIMWRDEHRDGASDASDHQLGLLFLRYRDFQSTQREALTYTARQQLTIRRSEEMIETMIWNGVRVLRSSVDGV